MTGYAAIVLAGGRARRLGGADKPALPVGGRPLLHRVLDAVPDAYPRIVVGPPRELPAGVLGTREQPPGGGPVAALAAGFALLDATQRHPARRDLTPPDPTRRAPARRGRPGTGRGGVAQVAVLAGDLPFLTPHAVRALRAAATADVALYTDGERRQLLCAVWRLDPLRERLAALGDPAGAALRQLYAGATVTELTSDDTPPPWYDADTPADLHQAERWYGRLTE